MERYIRSPALDILHSLPPPPPIGLPSRTYTSSSTSSEAPSCTASCSDSSDYEASLAIRKSDSVEHHHASAWVIQQQSLASRIYREPPTDITMEEQVIGLGRYLSRVLDGPTPVDKYVSAVDDPWSRRNLRDSARQPFYALPLRLKSSTSADKSIRSVAQGVEDGAKESASQRNRSASGAGSQNQVTSRGSKGKSTSQGFRHGQDGDDSGDGSDDRGRPKGSRGRRKRTADKEILFPCPFCMFSDSMKAECIGVRVKDVPTLCKHLKRHGFEFSEQDLYLVEPTGQNPSTPDERRGLCRKCYAVFDRYDHLHDHVEHHKAIAAKGGQRATPDKHIPNRDKFLVIVRLFVWRLSLSDVRNPPSIPSSTLENNVKVKKETYSQAATPQASGAVTTSGPDGAINVPREPATTAPRKRNAQGQTQATPERPSKQRKPSDQHAVAADISPSSSQVPSLRRSSAASSTDNASAVEIDPSLEDSVSADVPRPLDKTVPEAAPADAFQAPTYAFPSQIGSQFGPESTSGPIPFDGDGSNLDPGPLWLPQSRKYIQEDTVESWTGQTATVMPDGSFVLSDEHALFGIRGS